MVKQSRFEGSAGTVRRVVATIEFINKADSSVAINDLVRYLQIPRSSAYGIVRKLMEADWLERKDGGYGIGKRLANLKFNHQSGLRLVTALEPIIDGLRDSSGETVQLSVMSGDKVLVVAKADGRQPISVISQVGIRTPINWSAAGRLLASATDDHELQKSLPSMIVSSPTGKAPTDPARILAEIRTARRRGYFSQVNQSILHAGSLSAAIRGRSGKCIAAISILAPEHRMRSRRREFLSLLLPAVRNASETLAE